MEPGHRIGPSPTPEGNDGFAAMGKPVPMDRRDAAFRHAKQMGLSGADAWDVIGKVADAIERDEPYRAMQEGTRRLDLIGTYRLMAVLMTEAPKAT